MGQRRKMRRRRLRRRRGPRLRAADALWLELPAVRNLPSDRRTGLVREVIRRRGHKRKLRTKSRHDAAVRQAVAEVVAELRLGGEVAGVTLADVAPTWTWGVTPRGP